MTDKLIEAVARAMYESKWGDWDLMASDSQDKWRIDARAAIAAIEASGTHAVVPVIPTDRMEETADRCFDGGMTPTEVWNLMLKNCPKVLP